MTHEHIKQVLQQLQKLEQDILVGCTEEMRERYQLRKQIEEIAAALERLLELRR